MTDRESPRSIMVLAALVEYSAGKIPFLWVDDTAPVSASGSVGDQINVTIALALEDGFELVYDPEQPPVPTIKSWSVELDADSTLTVR